MRKFVFIFVLAVIVPSALLGWFAFDSLRDQELVFERQQELLLQSATDTAADKIRALLAARLQEFAASVESFEQPADRFDPWIREHLSWVQVGFVASLQGRVLAPVAPVDPASQKFLQQNGSFLTDTESVSIFQKPAVKDETNLDRSRDQSTPAVTRGYPSSPARGTPTRSSKSAPKAAAAAPAPARSERNVNPQKEPREFAPSLSIAVPSNTEFSQLVGKEQTGSLARFAGAELNLIFWHRLSPTNSTVYGILINLAALTENFRATLESSSSLAPAAVFALVGEKGTPVAISQPDFRGAWKRPFVATEVSELLPYWEIGAYLRDPGAFSASATNLRQTFGSLILLLLGAISVGGWLIWRDVRRQIKLARQKTDFVSNVSHELKTPLTSIRLFSELLVERAGNDQWRQYADIIKQEATRLSRLIDNVLDFSRLERPRRQRANGRPTTNSCSDLNEVVTDCLAHYRPTLPVKVESRLHPDPIPVPIDPDAVAQVLLNLLSNAEKYGRGQVTISTAASDRFAELHVVDNGPGVPPPSEKKIFREFYRADDALNSGVRGAGLGLTLSRQIARTHQGDVIYQPAVNGGSHFTLRLPLARTDPA